MTLRTTKVGRDLITEFEGWGTKLPDGRFKAYRCPAGVWTIGRGITTASGLIRVTPDLVITAAEEDRLFTKGIDQFEDKVEQLLGPKASAAVNSNQFDALVSFAWNVGTGALAKSTLLKLVKAGKYEAAARDFIKWNKAEGRVMNGLTRRRVAEAALFTSEIEPHHVAGLMADVEMPQAVDAPEQPKSMGKSTIGNGALAGGALGSISAGKELFDQAQAAVQQGTDIWTTIKDLSPWALVAILVLIIAGYVWVERRRLLKIEGV